MYDFSRIFEVNLLAESMASGQSDELPSSSDDEDFFAGFTVEEIGHIRQDRKRRQEQELLRNVDDEIEALIEQQAEENGNNSDLDTIADDDEGNSGKDSDEETASTASEEAASNRIQWSNTLRGINGEEFSIRHGPTKDLGDNANAKDFFDLFIDNAYLDEIVCNTVAYTCSKGDQTFVTNRAEISAYLGLNILIVIHELPQLSMYWESDYFIGVEGFKKTIPKQCFVPLGKYFHIANPNSEDRTDLTKVRPLVSLLEQKFAEAYIPGKNITVDEGLVKFNGRLSFTQYMPMKPDKFGIKVWLLANVDSYYVPRFQVYLGKNHTNNDLFHRKGLGYYVVWTPGESYLDNYRHFFCDNFFTSADLMTALESRNTYACGTVRTNRRDFPADLKRMKLVHGEVRTRQGGNLVATMWRDKRVVSLLSTLPLKLKSMQYRRLSEDEGSELFRQMADAMKKPEMVVVYNSGINGVDVNDQYRSYYPPGTTSRKWWKYLFWFFINLSMVNTFILEKLAGKKKRRQLDFRQELAKLLIAGYNGYKRPSNNGKRAFTTVTTEENLRGHFLGQMDGTKRACAMCAKRGRKRNEGRGCTFETTYACEQCGIPLCRSLRGEVPCFTEWHSGIV